jgi:hypothetical protein
MASLIRQRVSIREHGNGAVPGQTLAAKADLGGAMVTVRFVKCTNTRPLIRVRGGT